MPDLFRPILELSVIIPGMLLAYLPIRTCTKQSFPMLCIWLFPLLAAISVFGGVICHTCTLSTGFLLFPVLLLLLLLYQKTLQISFWKSLSIFLAVCAVFACVNSLSRALNAFLLMPQNPSSIPLWFSFTAGLLYNLICWLFVLGAWYPATHAVSMMIENVNFAQTWYVFWIIPVLFISLNLFMIPKHQGTLYTGRILQIYIVFSLVLLFILALFYIMFLMMANSLNRNARLQQENHFLALQRERYDNLCSAIEEARYARHDMRHHFLQLSSLAEHGSIEQIKDYLNSATNKIPDLNMHFCENKAADSVISYYCALAKREHIPFQSEISLPSDISTDEIDLCLIFSNLLENAVEASLKTTAARQYIKIRAYMPSPHLLLIQTENAYDGQIQEKKGIIQSSKRNGAGIGIQSVRHIAEKNGGGGIFSYENGIFTAQIMLRQ